MTLICPECMKIPTVKKVSAGPIKGWVREDIAPLLPPAFFNDPVSFIRGTGGEVIKESKLRWAAILTLPQGRRIFLKRDRTKGWFESLKYFLFPSKARKEWFMVYQLQKRNIPVPKPYGWMEKVRKGFVEESYYLSEAIGSGISFIDDSVHLGENIPIPELAKTVRKIHDSGLFHRDLHGGNFLWDGESFFLTDLHRARILKSLSLNQRLWNLSQLFHSLRTLWGRREQIRFLERYLEGGLFDLQRKEEILHKILSLMDSLQKRQWKSRTKRCLKESTEFSVKKEKGVITYHRKDFPLDRLIKVVEGHLSTVQKNPTLLVKNSPEVTVSLSKSKEGRICVKQFRYPRFWDRLKETFRTSKGLRAWISGNGLRTRGIASPKTLALVERKIGLTRRESFLAMEASETDQEMDRYILEGLGDVQEKRYFIKTFARWLSCLHERNLYHRDMKTCNILVSENGETWNFYLLDLEDVLLDEKVDERKLFKNFLQLNTSTPKNISTTDRFRFFKEYVSLNPIIKDRKGFLQRLIEESKRRGLVYVSPQGVVIEKI
ncbi:MAG: lipopolysaccharide kinase InaA family protein [Thermodesulfobacteriota bacterium]